MKKTISFGKIDYNHTGRRANAVEVDIEYRIDENGKKRFSVCGGIWNQIYSDTLSGGQNLEEIAKYIHTPLFKKIYRLWKLYHLNDTHPECEHQRELGWKEIARTEVKIYEFTLTSEACSKRRKIEHFVIENAKKGVFDTHLSKEDQTILNLTYSFKTSDDNMQFVVSEYYKYKGFETKTLGWLKESEHPDGILSKPCPVCGYKYGHTWKYMSIPEEDEQIIFEILGIKGEDEL